ncbi:MAG: putative acyltransferase [Pseudonocardiales bacterium]|nr:putative acyltransferase [Pseudonocardiales bacterium]
MSDDARLAFRPAPADATNASGVASPPRRPRLGYMEGLRGIVFGSVLLVHAAISVQQRGLTGRVLHSAGSGVDLFFVISGFCIVWPLLSPDGTLERLFNRTFFVRRAWRIIPPYVAAVSLAVAVSAAVWKSGRPSWWTGPMQGLFQGTSSDVALNLGSHLTFTHGLFARWDRSMDGAWWSLSVEWQFYLLLPLTLRLIRRCGMPVTVAIAGIASLAFAVVVHVIHPGAISNPVVFDTIASRAVEFAAGMLAAWLVVRRVRLAHAELLTVVLVALAITYDNTGGPQTFHPFAYAIAYGVLVFTCATSPRWRDALEHRWPRQLGRISYSGYLVHGSVYMAVALALEAIHADASMRLAVLVVAGPPLAVGIALVLHRTVEIPAARRSRRPIRGLVSNVARPDATDNPGHRRLARDS